MNTVAPCGRFGLGGERRRACARRPCRVHGTGIGSGCFYEAVVDGVPLTDFVRDLLDGITSHVGPEI